nr:hypothetical protein [Kibdelosporangium sp. MJ126-NF4]
MKSQPGCGERTVQGKQAVKLSHRNETAETHIRRNSEWRE